MHTKVHQTHPLCSNPTTEVTAHMFRQHWRPALTAALVALVQLGSLGPLQTVGPVNALATLPTGFSDSLFASGFGGRLTAMTFAPDGRLFVSEKQGAIRVVKAGALLTRPFLTLSTNTDAENGLKSIDFDPELRDQRALLRLLHRSRDGAQQGQPLHCQRV